MKQIPIDSYNVTHAIPQMHRQIELSLESARDALIEVATAISVN